MYEYLFFSTKGKNLYLENDGDWKVELKESVKYKYHRFTVIIKTVGVKGDEFRSVKDEMVCVSYRIIHGKLDTFGSDFLNSV